MGRGTRSRLWWGVVSSAAGRRSRWPTIRDYMNPGLRGWSWDQWRKSLVATGPSVRQCPCRPQRSGHGPDVLVHAEEVLRIVLGLHLPETRIVGAIGGADRVLRLVVAEVIHIAARGHEGLHLRVAVARPGHTAAAECRLHPFREHQEIVAFGALRERRVADRNP